MNRLGVAVAVVLSVQICAKSAHGQQLEEIIVTAEKRETSILDTPIAVSAIDGAALEKQKISTLIDFANSAPSLDVMRGGPNQSVAIRGIASLDFNMGTESRTAIHWDGVYISRPEITLLQLFDIERVEYLRGPQGTLYGRNATGGALNIISRDPEPTLGGYAGVTLGNYDTQRITGALNLPITESLGGRLAVDYNKHDGYSKDIVSGRGVFDLDTVSVRGKLKYDAGNDFVVRLTGSYFKEDDHDQGGSFGGGANPDVIPLGLRFGGTPGPFPDIATDSVGFPNNYKEFYSFAADAKFDDFAGGDLTAIVGHYHLKVDSSFDEQTSAPVTVSFFTSDSDAYTAELRYHRAGERYDFTGGAYYFKEDLTGIIGLGLNLLTLGGPDFFAQGIYTGGDATTEAYAGFMQMKYDMTSKFYAEVGVRYSYEKRSVEDGLEVVLDQPYSHSYDYTLSSPASGSDNWDSTDPRVTLGYKFSDDLHLYATYSRAFKSGGFNLGAGAKTFDPEEVEGFEVGLKYISPSRNLSANVAAFTYDYTNMQVQRVAEDGVNIELTNAAKSSIRGVEFEARWLPLPQLELGANASWLDAKYDDFVTAVPYFPGSDPIQLAGNPLPQAPRSKINVNATYTWSLGEGDLSLRGDATWRDKIYLSPFEFEPMSSPSTELYNAFLTYETEKWTLGAYVRNISDERVNSWGAVHGELIGFTILNRASDPRTYGASVTRRF